MNTYESTFTGITDRWLAHSGVHLARQQVIAKKEIGDNLEAEIAQFCFSHRVCNLPCIIKSDFSEYF